METAEIRYIMCLTSVINREIRLLFCIMHSPITLVVAKCWDPNPKGYLAVPHQEAVRPIDPSALVAHTEAARNTVPHAAPYAPSLSTVTSSTSSSLVSSMPPASNSKMHDLDLDLGLLLLCTHYVTRFCGTFWADFVARHPFVSIHSDK